MPGGKGVGVVRTVYPHHVGQQFVVGSGSSRWISCLTPPMRESVPGGKGVGVVRTVYLRRVLQQLLVGAGGTSRVPRRSSHRGEVVPGGEGVGVRWTQHSHEASQHLLHPRRGAGRVPALTQLGDVPLLVECVQVVRTFYPQVVRQELLRGCGVG